MNPQLTENFPSIKPQAYLVFTSGQQVDGVIEYRTIGTIMLKNINESENLPNAQTSKFGSSLDNNETVVVNNFPGSMLNRVQ